MCDFGILLGIRGNGLRRSYPRRRGLPHDTTGRSPSALGGALHRAKQYGKPAWSDGSVASWPVPSRHVHIRGLSGQALLRHPALDRAAVSATRSPGPLSVASPNSSLMASSARISITAVHSVGSGCNDGCLASCPVCRNSSARTGPAISSPMAPRVGIPRSIPRASAHAIR